MTAQDMTRNDDEIIDVLLSIETSKIAVMLDNIYTGCPMEQMTDEQFDISVRLSEMLGAAMSAKKAQPIVHFTVSCEIADWLEGYVPK